MICSLLLVLFVSIQVSAQVLTPAKVKVAVAKETLKAGEETELVISATIDDNWYMYSVDCDGECGPIPFSIDLSGSKGIDLVGKLRAIGHHTKYDKNFECDVNYFVGKGEWRQTIKITSANAKLSGIYAGQVCTDL